jgi:glycosyltransferase involved in cell wall biosynthesis
MDLRYRESPARDSLTSAPDQIDRIINPPDHDAAEFRLAVVLPCFNEEAAVTQVISDFRNALPGAEIYVFDNNSSDKTAQTARNAGAIVRRVNLPGKGNVVRRMFADVDADIYVMADGDATYHAASASGMIGKMLRENLDMVVGVRNHEASDAYRKGHKSGNRLLTLTMSSIFGNGFTDMLSGYRVFSRRFVKTFPAMSRGFEIETELAIHALELRMPCGEVSTPYGVRPQETESKLRTYSDGFRILRTIVKLFALEHPFRFYGLISAIFILTSILLSLPLLSTYFETGLVPRFPTAILSTGLAITGVISFLTGVILETVTVGRREIKQFHYLSMPSVSKLDSNQG